MDEVINAMIAEETDEEKKAIMEAAKARVEHEDRLQSGSEYW